MNQQTLNEALERLHVLRRETTQLGKLDLPRRVARERSLLEEQVAELRAEIIYAAGRAGLTLPEPTD